MVALQVAAARRAQVDATAIRLEDSVASDFATFEQRQLTDVRTLKGTIGVPEAIEAGDAARLQRLLFPVVANQLPDPLTATAVAKDGSVLLQVTGEPAHPGTCACTHSGDTGSWPFVDQALGDVSDRYGPKYVGVHSDGTGALLYTVSPVLLNGSPVGAMVVSEPLPALLKEAAGESALVAAVYSKQGALLGTTPGFPRGTAPLSASQMRSAEAGTDVVHTSIGTGAGALEVFYLPWQLRHAVFGYSAVVVPASALIGAAQDITRLMVAIFLAVSLVTFMAAVFVARMITRPLDVLVQATRQVASGNLAYRAKVVSHDEMASLTKAFNEMTGSLQERTEAIHHNTEATVLTLADAIDARDPYTHGHSVRVAAYSLAIAGAAGLPEEVTADIRQGCLVHDIGKIGVVDSILRKPGSLDDEESEEMRKHPEIGYQMLRHLNWGKRVMDIVRHHHERWDGTGYPAGLAGEAIPMAARLVAVADTFDAMTSDRPYRRGLSVAQAAAVIEKGAGKQFDPEMSGFFQAALAEVERLFLAHRSAATPGAAAEVGKRPDAEAALAG